MAPYATFDIDNISYKWIITDFHAHLERSKTEASYSLTSSEFYSKNYASRFDLSLLFYHLEFGHCDGFLRYYLNSDKYEHSLNVKISLYILNDKAEMIKKSDFNAGKSHSCNLSVGNDTFCKKQFLLDNADELLPNGTLILGCDIILYKVKYNNSTIYLRKSYLQEVLLKKMLESQDGADFKFIVDNQVFKAHKCMLVSCSSVFADMLMDETKEKETNERTITDIRPEIFKMFLEFVYTKNVAIYLNKNEIIELLSVANKYRLKDLKQICGERLVSMLKVKNAIEILLVAELYNFKELATYTEYFIKAYSGQVLKTIDSEHFVNNVHHLGLFLINK